MDGFVTRKRHHDGITLAHIKTSGNDEDDESTDFKLGLLASLHPEIGPDALLDALLASQGDVELASTALGMPLLDTPRKKARIVGYQASLTGLLKRDFPDGASRKPMALTKKGKTLYLYSPEDVEAHTPCSIIHNFLLLRRPTRCLRNYFRKHRAFVKKRFSFSTRL